eukprot:g3703.t1
MWEQPDFFKTKTCKMFASPAGCPEGEFCSYAHGNLERRAPPFRRRWETNVDERQEAETQQGHIGTSGLNPAAKSFVPASSLLTKKSNSVPMNMYEMGSPARGGGKRAPRRNSGVQLDRSPGQEPVSTLNIQQMNSRGASPTSSPVLSARGIRGADLARRRVVSMQDMQQVYDQGGRFRAEGQGQRSGALQSRGGQGSGIEGLQGGSNLGQKRRVSSFGSVSSLAPASEEGEEQAEGRGSIEEK